MPARKLLDDGLLLQKAGVLERALERYSAALAVATDPATVSEALRRQSHVYRSRCEWDRAVETAQRSAEVARDAGLQDLTAEAVNAEGAVYQSRGDLVRAGSLFASILDVTEDPRIRGVALQNLAAVCAMQGDLSAADRYFRDAYDCFNRADYPWGQAHILNNLGRLSLDDGRLAEAEELLRRAIEKARQVNDLELVAVARLNHADALMRRGEREQAEDEVSAALGHFRTTGNHWRSIECLRVLGDLNVTDGSLDIARRFYEAALMVAQEIEAPVEHEQIAARLAKLRE